MSETEPKPEAKDVPVPDLVIRALSGKWHPSSRHRRHIAPDVAMLLGVPLHVAHAAMIGFNSAEKRKVARSLELRAAHERNPIARAVLLRDAADAMKVAGLMVAQCMDILGRGPESSPSPNPLTPTPPPSTL